MTLQRGVQEDLDELLRLARSIQTDLQVGPEPAAKLGALFSLVDRLRAGSLLIASQQTGLEEHLLARGASPEVLNRQVEMAEIFRREFERLGQLLDGISARASGEADPSGLSAALDALVRHVASLVAPPDRTPLGVSLPYRSLNLPQVAPQLGPAIVPAYSDFKQVPATASDLAEGPEVPLGPEILAQARSLRQNPIEIFEFVQNQVEMEFYHGAIKGAAETLKQRRGNDVDQASLLVALMRASGVPARYVRGVIALSDKQALAWAGVSSTRFVADLFTRAGIPFRATRQGGMVGGFELEHTWVEVFVSYRNYRGAPLDPLGRSWIPLDPSLKSYSLTSGIDVLAAADFTADRLIAEYLAGPQTLSPVDFYRKRLTDYLTDNRPDLTLEQVIAKRALQPVALGLLPSTLPYLTISVNQETAVLPEALRHRVRFIAHVDRQTSFDVTIPASEIVGTRVTVSYVPATVEDQIAIDAFLGIDNTPAYLVQLRPVLKVGGAVRAAGEVPVQMGALHELAMEIVSPRTTVPISNPVLAGGYYAIGLASQRTAYEPPETRAPEDTEEGAADILYGLAVDFLEQWNQAEHAIADILRVVSVRPLLSEVMVGTVHNRTVLFGHPQTIEWRGVFVDADLRFSDPLPAGADANQDEGLRREFMRLSGLAGSMAESEVLERNLGADAVSAAKLIQLTRAGDLPIEEIDATNVGTVLPLLATADIVKTEIADAVNQGWRATIPRRDFTRQLWSGIGYILVDPQSGAGGYFISGGLAGGMTSQDPHEWVEQQLADQLGKPYEGKPNTDATSAVSIQKVAVTDHQDGKAGEPLSRPIAVWIRDLEGKPVQGAEVTFEIQAGRGRFEVEGQEQETITVRSDYLGVARATPTLGTRTLELPFYVLAKPEDEHVTQVGQNIVTARVKGIGGDIPLDVPFQLFAHPGEPTRIVKVLGDNNLSWAGTSAGTLLARVVDRYENPISNVAVDFKALAPTAVVSGPIPPTAINLTVYPQDSCANPTPIIGDCDGRDQLTVETSIFGAAVETILGETDTTMFQVSAALSGTSHVPAEVFTLFSGGDREFGTGEYKGTTLLFSLLHFVNDRGELLNGTRVGTTFRHPLEVVLRIRQDNFVLEPTGNPSCGPHPAPPCFKIKSLETNKITTAETAVVTFTPIQGGGAANPPVLSAPNQSPGQGRYGSLLTVGPTPALNRVEVDATADVEVPSIDLHSGTITPVRVTLKPGQTAGRTFDASVTPPRPLISDSSYTVTHEVFGVLPGLVEAKNLLVGVSGGTVKDFELPYTIEPPAYSAQTADIDVFEADPTDADAGADKWIGFVIGDKKSGSGIGKIFQGTAFDPTRRYRMQAVLNRGTEVEITSGKEALNAYLIGPFGADFRSRDNTAESRRRKKVIDLARELSTEKAALVGVITSGLFAAASRCGLPAPIAEIGISMIEQGSGACFWKPGFATDPVGTCAAFQPGVSDHDYEVFIPQALFGDGSAACIVGRLNEAVAVAQLDRAEEDTTLGDAAEDTNLGDVSFYAVPKEEFQSARLNLLPPTVPGGSDPTGDLGLGRQSLLLKWLLEGEYVKGIPGLHTPNESGTNGDTRTLPLETVLESLRTTPYFDGELTGIPRLEGYEWAVLQQFNFYKSGAHLRITGQAAYRKSITGQAAYTKSYLFELLQKEIHDAAKAAIRTAMARLVADENGNKLFFIRRPEYELGGCLTGTENPSKPRPPRELFPKNCDSFEEHIASTAVKSLKEGLGIFTDDQVAQIYQFFRIKAEPACAAAECQTLIIDEVKANQFLASALRFIQEVDGATVDVWSRTVGNDSPENQSQRQQNRLVARQKTGKAQEKAQRTLEVRVFNDNDREFRSIPLSLYSSAAPATPWVTHPIPQITPLSETIIDVKRDAEGNPVRDPQGKVQPIFEIELPATEQHQVTVFLDPEDKVKECDKLDNYSGFVAYPLDPNNPGEIPLIGDPLSPVPVPPPPEECLAHPLPLLKLTKLVNDQPHIKVAALTKVKVTNVVTNVGTAPAVGVRVHDLLLDKTYGPFDLPGGGQFGLPESTRTFTGEYLVTDIGKELVGPSEVVGFLEGGGSVRGWDSVAIDVVKPPCLFTIAPLQPDPNPYDGDGRPVSTLMEGGSAFRYYQVLDGKGGRVPFAPVGFVVNGATRFATTDANGLISHFVPEGEEARGLEIKAEWLGTPGPFTVSYPVSFVSVHGDASVCSQPFEVDFKPFTFTESLKGGGALNIGGKLAGAQLTLGEGRSLNFSLKRTKGELEPRAESLTIAQGKDFKGSAGFKFEVAGIAGVEGPAVGLTGGLGLGFGRKYLFSTLPLSFDDKVRVASVLLDTALNTTTLIALAGPLAQFVLDRLQDELEIPDSRDRLTARSLSVSLSEELSAQLFKVDFGLIGPNFVSSYPVQAEAKAGFKLTVTLGVEESWSPTTDPDVRENRKVAPSLALIGELNAKVGFEEGLKKAEGKIASDPMFPGSTEIDFLNQQVDALSRLNNLELDFGVSGGIRATLVLDSQAGFAPESVDFTFLGRKKFGFKLGADGRLNNAGSGDQVSRTYTVKGREEVERILKSFLNLGLLLDNVQKARLNIDPEGSVLVGPTVIFEQLVEFIHLMIRNAAYTSGRDRGEGKTLPLARFKLVVLGTGGEFEVMVNADHSVSFSTEQGVIRDASAYKLEKYPDDSVGLSSLGQALSTFDEALDIIPDIVGRSRFADVATDAAGCGLISGPCLIRSLLSAELRLANRTDFDAVQDLLSFKFESVPGPVAQALYSPEDIRGAAGKPHYGISGFHQFVLAETSLTAPATLILDYNDSEVTGLDEGSLAIYAWNRARADWDYLGGAVDTVNNTVTTTVTKLGLYTLGPAMPAGTLTFTVIPTSFPGRVTYRSGVIRMNNGLVVPDSTAFTVQTFLPHDTALAPFGTIVTADQDPLTEGIQVTSVNGVVEFTVDYPVPAGAARVLVFATTGTAMTEEVVPFP